MGTPVLIAAIWFDRPISWFTLLAIVTGLVAVQEFYRMVGVLKVLSLTSFGLLWTVLFILSPHFSYSFFVPFLFTSGLMLSLILLLFRPQKEGAYASWVWTIAGILYTGWLLSYLVALRLDAGRDWVVLVLFTTFATDTTAFGVGKAIGKYHLAPRISPAKTWEGAVGGVLGAITVSLIIVVFFRMPLSYWQAITFGLLVSVFAQFGDLAKSLLKRNMGVKESGRLLPGHGGILDRIDSVLFAAPVAYYFFLLYGSTAG